jgi:hypothetical protein
VGLAWQLRIARRTTADAERQADFPEELAMASKVNWRELSVSVVIATVIGVAIGLASGFAARAAGLSPRFAGPLAEATVGVLVGAIYFARIRRRREVSNPKARRGFVQMAARRKQRL